ncbi:MAG: RidA family protein [Trueperaceae bacterium]
MTRRKEPFGSAAAPLTPALKVGDTVYVSGQVPVGAEGTIVGDDVATQTRQVLENLEAQLRSAGATRADVVKTLVVLPHVKRDFAAMNEAYAAFFPDPKPARTTFGGELAIDILVEIEAVAVIGAGG